MAVIQVVVRKHDAISHRAGNEAFSLVSAVEEEKAECGLPAMHIDNPVIGSVRAS